MGFPVKKVFFNINFNFFLFLVLIIGIQNSSEKTKLNLFINETVDLPISFIIGTSFITGSLLGGLIPLEKLIKK